MITILGSGGHGWKSLSEFLKASGEEFEFFLLTVDWGQVNFGGFNGTWGRILEWENEKNNRILHPLKNFLMPILPCGDLNKILMYFWLELVGEIGQNLDVRSDNLEILQNLWQELIDSLNSKNSEKSCELNSEISRKTKESLQKFQKLEKSAQSREKPKKTNLANSTEINLIQKSLAQPNLAQKAQEIPTFDSLILEFENYLPVAFTAYIEGKKTLNLQARGPSLGYFWHTFLFWKSWQTFLNSQTVKDNSKNNSKILGSDLQKIDLGKNISEKEKWKKMTNSEKQSEKQTEKFEKLEKLSEDTQNLEVENEKSQVQKTQNSIQNSIQSSTNSNQEIPNQIENNYDENFVQVMRFFNSFYHQSGILPEKVWVNWTSSVREILTGNDGEIEIVGEEILDEWLKPILPQSLKLKTKNLQKIHISQSFLQKLESSNWIIIPTGSVANWLPLVNEMEICQILKTKNAQNKLIWVQNSEKNTQEFAVEIYQKYLETLGLFPIKIETKNFPKNKISSFVSQEIEKIILQNSDLPKKVSQICQETGLKFSKMNSKKYKNKIKNFNFQ